MLALSDTSPGGDAVWANRKGIRRLRATERFPHVVRSTRSAVREDEGRGNQHPWSSEPYMAIASLTSALARRALPDRAG